MKPDSTGVIGRSGSQIELDFDKNIKMTTDESQDNSIIINDKENIVKMSSGDILLSSINNTNEEYSILYGERMLELLRWIIFVLKTHSHPPNAEPIPDFFDEANKWIQKLDDYLLNKNVRTR